MKKPLIYDENHIELTFTKYSVIVRKESIEVIYKKTWYRWRLLRTTILTSNDWFVYNGNLNEIKVKIHFYLGSSIELNFYAKFQEMFDLIFILIKK